MVEKQLKKSTKVRVDTSTHCHHFSVKALRKTDKKGLTENRNDYSNVGLIKMCLEQLRRCER